MKIILLAMFMAVVSGCSSSTQSDATHTGDVSETTEPLPSVTPAEAIPTSPQKPAAEGHLLSTVPASSKNLKTADYNAATAPDPNALVTRPEVQTFIQEMVTKHNFDPHELFTLFGRIQSQPDIIALITRPAEAKPWHVYREIFITPRRIQGGVTFWETHQAALARAEKVYGVAPEIIVAIIGVETAYGENTGKHRVLEALATLAFDYPKRANFFRKELENYLLLAREERIDPLSLQGSYAGATGLGQFMPSSYRAYALDFNGDRRRDLWNNPEDAIGSVANYLKAHQWQRGQPIATRARVVGRQYQEVLDKSLQKPSRPVTTFYQRGIVSQMAVDDSLPAMLLELQGKNDLEYWLGFDNFYVITRYNHSSLYAMAVYQLSQYIRRRKELNESV